MNKLDRLLKVPKLPRRGNSHQDSSKLQKQETPVWDSPHLKTAALRVDRLLVSAMSKNRVAADGFFARISLGPLMQCTAPMRRTLLAIGFAVLVSMMLAPRGNKYVVYGFGPFFSIQGLTKAHPGDWYLGWLERESFMERSVAS
jgi:hypothetical protein